MERVIVCPVCHDSDSCFEEIQEHFSSYMCFNCGFMSDSRYRIGSVELIDNMTASPQLVQDLQYHDEKKGIVWFPCVINMGERGIIYPDEDTSAVEASYMHGNKKKYVWKYAKVAEIPEEERAKYDNYDKRLDVENAQVYSKHEFFKACQDMGIIKDLKVKDGISSETQK